jgi:hypothetical protein
MKKRMIRRSGWRLTLLLAIAIGALAVGGFAYSAGGPNAQLVNQDRAYGGGTYTPFNTRNFAIDAHASGAAAYGNVEFAVADGHVRQEQVTCLSVSGNKATIGGIITASSSDPSFVGFFFVWVVQDNGSPLSGTPDAAAFQVFRPTNDPAWPGGFPYVCPLPDDVISTFGLDLFPLSGGDIVVHQSGQ